ncbi:hypothetical protein S7711_03956 [Stachybotrys chartarum IBT 7711]|uniref:Uncharacterized protein n=1 Tax=Stachybotrys chartarum (strain CBS 109288 / IBT 7711) TaxID=1280523 RepID=A0A084AQX5_STACB|nr:hypothetical protein S7711_03956 [Stachybotrys chartarum IBT 7711]KFA54808.1 hypothetical protein S40293_00713 [Stachybotrys chartarum IBT 40293]
MPRDRDVEAASSGGQSKRPPLSQHDSADPPSDSPSTSTTSTAHQGRHHKQHQKQHHHVGGGRFHARVPSSKALHKHHGPPGAKLTRRITSPPPEVDPAHRSAAVHSHRRAASEVKLPRQTSSGNITPSASQTNLKRNRSHVEVGKRNRSSDKLKRLSNGGGGANNRPPALKSQVHFDLGNDNEDHEDEWVDASGSNSPYLSRKGSINISAPSVQSTASTDHSRPESPTEPAQKDEPSTPERQRLHHKEYLTSRLLQRTPSYGAPPQMSNDVVMVGPGSQSSRTGAAGSSALVKNGKNGSTSNFAHGVDSGAPSESSYSRQPSVGSYQSEEMPHRPHSLASSPQKQDQDTEDISQGAVVAQFDNSALVPRTARRTAVPSAETSRVQQKLNLQRASSAIEPNQPIGGVGGLAATNPLIGVSSPGYDRGNSRDPRVAKLLERTGMEYLVVRRYQNPIARSLVRLSNLPNADKSKRIPRANTGSTNSRRSLDLSIRHARNPSNTDPRRSLTLSRAASVRTTGASSSYEEDENRLNERLSGTSLVGTGEEDGTAALLRNLWEKLPDLSASTD